MYNEEKAAGLNNLIKKEKEFKLKKADKYTGLEEIPTQFAWVHLSCAQWIPEVVALPKQGIRISKLEEKRYSEPCSICKTSFGVSYKCSSVNHDCPLKFHVECARRSNYYLEVVKSEGPVSSGGAGGGVQNRDEKRLFCESHRPLKLIRDIEEKKKFMVDEIVTYANVVKKCTDIIERNRN